jgi:hypothetical protein
MICRMFDPAQIRSATEGSRRTDYFIAERLQKRRE